jgi:ferredoxin-NADP reductase
MAPMTFTGTLLEKLRRTDDSASFRFSRPPEYHFEAGQSYSITIPSPDGPLEHRFSHADSPTEPHTELTTRMTGSPFKKALDALAPGADATFRGPSGRFLFRYSHPRLAFLVGGVGITPVRSMLRYLADTGGAGRVPEQQLVLFYGCSTEAGIVYREELDEFARTIPGFRLVYVISAPIKSWTGLQGHITFEIVRSELGDDSSWIYYIVGPPPMVAAMEEITGLMQVPQADIVKESFAGYAS